MRGATKHGARTDLHERIEAARMPEVPVGPAPLDAMPPRRVEGGKS